MNARFKLASMLAVASTLVGAPAALAQYAAAVTYPTFHNHRLTVTNTAVAINSGTVLFRSRGQVVVTPGSRITVTGSYATARSNVPADYADCSSCVHQFYMAWLPAAIDAGATPRNVGLWSGLTQGPNNATTVLGSFNGNFTFTTTVPNTPGDYMIGFGESLDFGFNPNVAGRLGNDSVTNAPAGSFRVVVMNAPRCNGDANGDNRSDFTDITSVLANFNITCP
ncbi:MAG: hypothetical protein SFZ24_06030 [Planctomycetota bacterium]|nr:hypothetical protein [Planctomycetota bacterium]